MPQERLRVADSLSDLKRLIWQNQAALIVVPVYNALTETIRCIESLLQHSPADSEILIIDDSSTDSRVPEFLASLRPSSASIYLWRHEENLGFVRTMNQAFEVSGRRDVLLVNSDVIVGPEWFERLQAAAHSDNRVATATPLTNHGIFLSIPNGTPTRELPTGHTPKTAALAVAQASRQHYPSIPVCVGHVVYFRRFALDLIGLFDEDFSPGYSEEIDFSLRCRFAGLTHVCADDVFVYHSGSASFGHTDAVEHRRKGFELVGKRYPFYYEWVGGLSKNNRSPLGAAIATAQIALSGVRLLVDATCLGPEVAVGTQRVTLEVVAALSRHKGVSQLGVLLSSPQAKELIKKYMPVNKEIDLIMASDRTSYPKHVFDFAFRPFQVHGSTRELLRLHSLANRTAVWQLDFISYENPFYKPDLESWQALRDLTRLTLGSIDGVATLSNNIMVQGRMNGAIRPETCGRVIYPGVDHSTSCAEPIRPPSIPLDSRYHRYVLIFGTDYRHKNRPFAMSVFAAMLRRGYEGSLILAGAHIANGSSRSEESFLFRENPTLKSHTLLLGSVTEQEREWLFRNADLILYPSLSEGFGLIPFEAAAASVPCLPSRNGSLDEVLPQGIEWIQDWDAESAAESALKLINEPSVRARQIELIRARARDFTWDSCATQIIGFAADLCRMASPRVVALVGEKGNVLGVLRAGQVRFSTSFRILSRVAKLANNPPRGLGQLSRVAKLVLRRPYRALRKIAEGK